MEKKLLIVGFFYLLVLIQSSFLVFFGTIAILLNLAAIAVVVINIIERPKSNFGIFSAFVAGFCLDIFSQGYFGLNILLLMAISFLIKLILRKYLRLAF